MKKPWNIAELPVYSLATSNENIVNMNICTYVVPVSMHPKLYAVAVYRDTKTLANLSNSETAVLQYLSREQYPLVRVLGRKTGHTYNKQSYLTRKGLLERWNGHDVLINTAARVLLQKISSSQQGDHHLFIMQALRSQSFHADVLTTGILSEKKLIRC